MGYLRPNTLRGSSVSVLLYVDNADQLFTSAINAGATAIMPIQDQFDGDRRGTLTVPLGHRWLIATKLTDVSPDELKQRFTAMLV
jgi:PhnB protein